MSFIFGLVVGFLSASIIVKLQLKNSFKEIDNVAKEYQEGMERVKKMSRDCKELHDDLQRLKQLMLIDK